MAEPQTDHEMLGAPKGAALVHKITADPAESREEDLGVTTTTKLADAEMTEADPRSLNTDSDQPLPGTTSEAETEIEDEIVDSAFAIQRNGDVGSGREPLVRRQAMQLRSHALSTATPSQLEDDEDKENTVSRIGALAIVPTSDTTGIQPRAIAALRPDGAKDLIDTPAFNQPVPLLSSHEVSPEKRRLSSASRSGTSFPSLNSTPTQRVQPPTASSTTTTFPNINPVPLPVLQPGSVNLAHVRRLQRYASFTAPQSLLDTHLPPIDPAHFQPRIHNSYLIKTISTIKCDQCGYKYNAGNSISSSASTPPQTGSGSARNVASLVRETYQCKTCVSQICRGCVEERLEHEIREQHAWQFKGAEAAKTVARSDAEEKEDGEWAEEPYRWEWGGSGKHEGFKLAFLDRKQNNIAAGEWNYCWHMEDGKEVNVSLLVDSKGKAGGPRKTTGVKRQASPDAGDDDPAHGPARAGKNLKSLSKKPRLISHEKTFLLKQHTAEENQAAVYTGNKNNEMELEDTTTEFATSDYVEQGMKFSTAEKMAHIEQSINAQKRSMTNKHEARVVKDKYFGPPAWNGRDVGRHFTDIHTSLTPAEHEVIDLDGYWKGQFGRAADATQNVHRHPSLLDGLSNGPTAPMPQSRISPSRPTLPIVKKRIEERPGALFGSSVRPSFFEEEDEQQIPLLFPSEYFTDSKAVYKPGRVERNVAMHDKARNKNKQVGTKARFTSMDENEMAQEIVRVMSGLPMPFPPDQMRAAPARPYLERLPYGIDYSGSTIPKAWHGAQDFHLNNHLTSLGNSSIPRQSTVGLSGPAFQGATHPSGPIPFRQRTPLDILADVADCQSRPRTGQASTAARVRSLVERRHMPDDSRSRAYARDEVARNKSEVQKLREHEYGVINRFTGRKTLNEENDPTTESDEVETIILSPNAGSRPQSRVLSSLRASSEIEESDRPPVPVQYMTAAGTASRRFGMAARTTEADDDEETEEEESTSNNSELDTSDYGAEDADGEADDDGDNDESDESEYDQDARRGLTTLSIRGRPQTTESRRSARHPVAVTSASTSSSRISPRLSLNGKRIGRPPKKNTTRTSPKPARMSTRKPTAPTQKQKQKQSAIEYYEVQPAKSSSPVKQQGQQGRLRNGKEFAGGGVTAEWFGWRR